MGDAWYCSLSDSPLIVGSFKAFMTMEKGPQVWLVFLCISYNISLLLVFQACQTLDTHTSQGTQTFIKIRLED